MLLVIAAVIVAIWLLGIIAIHIASPLINLLVVIALIIFIYDMISRRRRD